MSGNMRDVRDQDILLSDVRPTGVKDHVYQQTATLSEVLSGHIIEDVAFIINHNSE